MKLKFLVNCQGSPNGINVLSFKKGSEHEVPTELANVFVYEGMAEEVKDAPEEKSAKAAPENKSMGNAKKAEK